VITIDIRFEVTHARGRASVALRFHDWILPAVAARDSRDLQDINYNMRNMRVTCSYMSRNGESRVEAHAERCAARRRESELLESTRDRC